jgi:sortase (surface protein transpeptidase)
VNGRRGIGHHAQLPRVQQPDPQQPSPQQPSPRQKSAPQPGPRQPGPRQKSAPQPGLRQKGTPQPGAHQRSAQQPNTPLSDTPLSGTPRPLKALRRLIGPLLLVVPLLVAVVLGGCGSQRSATPSSANSAGVVTSASLPKSIPLSIDIPKIGAQSTLLTLSLTRHQTVQLPSASTPMQAGWFSGGPTPGQIGPATIFGHVDGDHQEGIFFRLYELVPGDLVLIKRQDGSTVTFKVTHTEQVSKGSFPTDAVRGSTTDAELRLVTCGGTFDPATHSYRNNIIVFATLVANPS